MGTKIRVMNPMGYPPKITQLGMAPRLDTLDGKTVYLVDCRFDDGDLRARARTNEVCRRPFPKPASSS